MTDWLGAGVVATGALDGGLVATGGSDGGLVMVGAFEGGFEAIGIVGRGVGFVMHLSVQQLHSTPQFT